MNGSPPNSAFDPAEELGPRTRRHDPVWAVGAPGRYVPGRREPAEMIEADQVHVRQKRAKTIDPPPVPVRAERLPIVNRVAPQLPCRAEVIGRHAHHKFGRQASSREKSSGFAQTSLESGETKNGRSPISLTSLSNARTLLALRLAGNQKLLEPYPVDLLSRVPRRASARAPGRRRTSSAGHSR